MGRFPQPRLVEPAVAEEADAFAAGQELSGATRIVESTLDTWACRDDDAARTDWARTWMWDVGCAAWDLGNMKTRFEGMRSTTKLLRLTAEDLNEIGVTAVGHRRVLLAAIEALARPAGGGGGGGGVVTPARASCHVE